MWYPRRTPVGPTRSCGVWGRALLEGRSSPIIPCSHSLSRRARPHDSLPLQGLVARQRRHDQNNPARASAMGDALCVQQCWPPSATMGAGVPTRKSRRLRRSRRAAEEVEMRRHPDTLISSSGLRDPQCSFRVRICLTKRQNAARSRQAASSRRGVPPRRAERDAVTPAGGYPEVPPCPVPASRALS